MENINSILVKVESMRISVRVVPNAREPGVLLTAEGIYHVRVDAKAVGGKANRRLIEILSDHFHVPKSSISLLSGSKSREKTFEIAVGANRGREDR